MIKNRHSDFFLNIVSLFVENEEDGENIFVFYFFLFYNQFLCYDFFINFFFY